MGKNNLKKLEETITLPEGINAEIKDQELIISKGSEQIKKTFSKINLVKEKNNLILSANGKITRREKEIFGTWRAHINNVIKGLQEKFVYKLKICNVHFPMNVNVDQNAKEIIIKNFLGEKEMRKAKIIKNVEVEIKGDVITIKSSDIEGAGQTAANIESVTKVTGRDRRIFQDGIFITHKPGRVI